MNASNQQFAERAKKTLSNRPTLYASHNLVAKWTPRFRERSEHTPTYYLLTY